MHIRPYQQCDESEIVRLWRECGLVTLQNKPLRDIERKAGVNPEWFLVGEQDGQIIATCMAGYEGHRGWINYLAVAPSHQRNGHATAIMNHAEKLLRTTGCPKINLQVRTTNGAVIEFYRSIGFIVDDVVSMGKRIEPDLPQQANPIEPSE